MIKVIFKQLQELDFAVSQLYARNPSLKQSKFGYSYNRFFKKNYEKPLKEFQEAIVDVRIDNALVDEKTQEILTDQTNPRGYKYSKEGLKKVIKDENKIIAEWQDRQVEVEPFFSPFVPEELTEGERELMVGLIIPVNGKKE